MNGTSENISYTLLVAPYQLNIWVGSFLWITGNLGCIGNMLVFSSREFRHRTYAIYLFSAEISNFYYFNFVLLTRILQQGFQIPLSNRYVIICKLRQFSTLWGNVVSFSLFSFAMIDRLLSTQRANKYRQWSNRVSLAYKMVILIPLFWLLVIGHRLILYQIISGSCGPPKGFYEYYDNYFQVIFSSFSPAITMSILAYLFIRNVRGVMHRRIMPVQNVPSTIQQMDKQLTKMLILETLITIITYVPYAIELTYTNITAGWYKTPLRIAWENVFIELIHLLSYVFFASSFYLSIISNRSFRRTIQRFLSIEKHNQTAAIIFHHQGTVTNQPNFHQITSKMNK